MPNAENIVAGRQPVLEALKARQPLQKIFIQHGINAPAIQQIKELARQQRVPVAEADRERLAELSAGHPAQGVVALLGEQAYLEAFELVTAARNRGEVPFLLVLDEIEDPHNLGALLRTAECAGVHGVLIPKHHAASVTATVAKTSAGASAHVPIARVTNVAQALEELKQEGVWIVGTDAEGERPYYEHDYTGPLAIVVGNEGRGIRRLVKEKCDFLVRIPLHGKVASLNASVAGAIVLFEAAKVRPAAKKPGA
jgi:23S rRNA (guanosine2251-2'-O)-methyltransferase